MRFSPGGGCISTPSPHARILYLFIHTMYRTIWVKTIGVREKHVCMTIEYSSGTRGDHYPPRSVPLAVLEQRTVPGKNCSAPCTLYGARYIIHTLADHPPRRFPSGFERVPDHRLPNICRVVWTWPLSTLCCRCVRCTVLFYCLCVFWCAVIQTHLCAVTWGDSNRDGGVSI